MAAKRFEPYTFCILHISSSNLHDCSKTERQKETKLQKTKLQKAKLQKTKKDKKRTQKASRRVPMNQDELKVN